MAKIVGNQKILIDHGFYLDKTYKGKRHVKYIHKVLLDIFFNERGTDKIRHCLKHFTKGTLTSSHALTQKEFEDYHEVCS
jgi:hypothetical protein